MRKIATAAVILALLGGTVACSAEGEGDTKTATSVVVGSESTAEDNKKVNETLDTLFAGIEGQKLESEIIDLMDQMSAIEQNGDRQILWDSYMEATNHLLAGYPGIANALSTTDLDRATFDSYRKALVTSNPGINPTDNEIVTYGKFMFLYSIASLGTLVEDTEVDVEPVAITYTNGEKASFLGKDLQVRGDEQESVSQSLEAAGVRFDLVKQDGVWKVDLEQWMEDQFQAAPTEDTVDGWTETSDEGEPVTGKTDPNE